ncbi:MAG TPA: hypothetical protein VN783_15295 [Thermoanaerobaculia bacterium]|nr:hypothetical protein [Thermoanaerobaculia bacterium]
MNAARTTLCRWLLAGLIERGCDPWSARKLERVPRIRTLTDAEVARLRSLALPVVLVGNVVPFPRRLRAPALSV